MQATEATVAIQSLASDLGAVRRATERLLAEPDASLEHRAAASAELAALERETQRAIAELLAQYEPVHRPN